MLTPSGTIPYHLLLRVEFTAPVLSGRVFASDAAWLARLEPALARARLDEGPVLVRITLTVPRGENAPPPLPEELDSGFIARVLDILTQRGLAATANSIRIQESAEPCDGLCLEIAIYGQPR